jgi:hypothetical protein
MKKSEVSATSANWKLFCPVCAPARTEAELFVVIPATLLVLKTVIARALYSALLPGGSLAAVSGHRLRRNARSAPLI